MKQLSGNEDLDLPVEYFLGMTHLHNKLLLDPEAS